MKLDLDNKIIMVAAGSKGLGYAIAEKCAQSGATVSIASRSADNVAAAAEKLRAQGATVHEAVVDARDGASITAWKESILAEFGRVDGLVVNAGGPPAGRFNDFEEQDWYDAFELTLMSSVRMIRAVLPTMQAQQSGAILTVTSLSVKEPIETILLSNVMRAGVTSVVKSLSKDVAKQGIRINNLIPGTIYTDRIVQLGTFRANQLGITVEAYDAKAEAGIPMGRYGQPGEFGNAGAFLLSDAASYITGASLIVDGGLSRTVW